LSVLGSQFSETEAEILLRNGQLELRTAFMPMVQITMLEGRSADQKRKIAKRITDALVEEAGARREGIVVAFNEVSKENYASGGELMIDKNK
jgi:4-oxalocrotonate tautomerase